MIQFVLSRRQLLVLATGSLLTLEGCGGTERFVDTPVTPWITIHWHGALTRTEAPSLAQSARVRLTPISGSTAVEALLVRAEPTVDAVTRYPLPGTLTPGKIELTVDFFADKEGLGLKIASGVSEVDLFPVSGTVADLTVADDVVGLSLPNALTLTVGETITLRPNATLTNGMTAAIPMATLHWEFSAASENRFSLTGDQLTVRSEGQASLQLHAHGLPDAPHSATVQLTALSRPPAEQKRIAMAVKMIGVTASGTLLALEWANQWTLIVLNSRTGERQIPPTLPDTILAYGLSPEGTHLWFYGTQTRKLFRLTLASGEIVTFPTLPKTSRTPQNIIPLRGSTTRVLVEMQAEEGASQHLALEAGVPVGNPLEGYFGEALAASENTFYLWESYSKALLTRYEFSESSLTQKESKGIAWPAQRAVWNHGKLYFGSLGIVEGQSYAPLGGFNAPSTCGNAPPVFSPSGRRALFVAYLGNRLAVLYVYDTQTQQKLIEHWYEQVREDVAPTALWIDESSVILSDFAALLILPDLVV